MILFWLGFVTSMQLSIVGAVAYVIWRYVWAPWKVMRKDVADLNAKCSETLEKANSVLSKATLLTNEELAHVEKRLLAQRRV